MGTTNFFTNLTLIVSMGAELILPDESYDLVGCAYTVFNKLKFGHQERIYQRAYATELKELGILILFTPEGIKYKRIVN